jgi:hypothetical protein
MIILLAKIDELWYSTYMSRVERKQFDDMLGRLNSQPKEYDYEYSLTTLVFGSYNVLDTKEAVQNLNAFAGDHPLFIEILDQLLNITFVEEKYKSL